MNTRLPNTSESAISTPEKAMEINIEGNFPKMGDSTVAYINKALDFVRHDPRLFRFMFDIHSFEMDVMVVNQYHCVSLSTIESNEILPENSWEKGSRAYLRAYKIAQIVFGRYKQLETNSPSTFAKHSSM